MDKWDAKLVGKARAYIAGIGIVAVDNVGERVVFLKKSDHVVGKEIEMIPQLLLGQILFRTGIDADNPQIVAKDFQRLRSYNFV